MARKNRMKMGLLAIVLSGLGVFALAGNGVASLLETRTVGVALEDLTNDIYFARRTAADTKTPVTVCQSEDASSCANNGRWESGWLMFEDYDRDSVRDPHEKILRSQGPVSHASVGKYRDVSPMSPKRAAAVCCSTVGCPAVHPCRLV